MNELACVDTNVFIRLFTNDDPAQTAVAHALFLEGQKGTLFFVINDLIFAEIAWVLRKPYNLSPDAIRKHLLAITNMPFIEIRAADLTVQLTDALDLHVTKNIEFTDAYIASWMLEHGISIIYTFNSKHFSRVEGIDVRIPGK